MRTLLEQLNIDPGLLLTQAVGFVIVLLILKRFLFRPIQRVLQERQDHLREQMEQADHDRQTMERARAEYEQRLAVIEGDARDRIQQAMQEAEEARRDIVAQARSEAERVLARAREDISHERQQALVELRDEMARLAVLGAEKIIEQKLDEETHHRLIASFLADLEQRQC